jgi:hypothetical protein
MPETKKILGWGRCSVDGHDDIVEDSTSLEVEEGDEQEANIEGGTAEGRKHAPDKYALTYNRRIGSASEVQVGYTEDAGDVTVTPENAGAVGVTLKECSRHVSVKFDAKDGLVAVYKWKTKGKTDSAGKLTDIEFAAKAASGGA